MVKAQKVAPRFLFSAIVGGFLCALALGAPTNARAAVVPTHLANSESLGAGFDILIEAFVGDYGIGSNNLDVLFRFSNPSFAQGGSVDSSDGAQARIHEIYFETGLGDDLDFFGTNNTSPGFDYLGQTDATSGTTFSYPTASPPNPPGIAPAWNGSAFEFDEGHGATGVGNGEYFEAAFDILSESPIIDEASLLAILRDRDVNSRIALHIGDCDGSPSCVIDSWPPSEVPVPAALPLFLTGLAGLGVIARRRKKTA